MQVRTVLGNGDYQDNDNIEEVVVVKSAMGKTLAKINDAQVVDKVMYVNVANISALIVEEDSED